MGQSQTQPLVPVSEPKSTIPNATQDQDWTLVAEEPLKSVKEDAVFNEGEGGSESEVVVAEQSELSLTEFPPDIQEQIAAYVLEAEPTVSPLIVSNEIHLQTPPLTPSSPLEVEPVKEEEVLSVPPSEEKTAETLDVPTPSFLILYGEPNYAPSETIHQDELQNLIVAEIENNRKRTEMYMRARAQVRKPMSSKSKCVATKRTRRHDRSGGFH